MLSNHALPKVLRIGAWGWRFICNCRNQARKSERRSNQHRRNSVPRAVVNQKGSKLSSPTTHLPSGQTTVEPAVQRQASLRMPRKNYGGISNLPPRRLHPHSQAGVQCSLTYSSCRYRPHHGEGPREILGTSIEMPCQEVERELPRV